ncbi:MAG: DUF6808 domain-containing protein [Rikenellaceae bacterium]
MYIVILLVLCAGSFWLGTRQVAIVESTETIVEIKPVLVDDPEPPIEVTPTEDVAVEKLPVVNYEALKMQIVDSLIAIGYSRSDVDKIAPIITPDSVKAEIPLDDFIFKKDSLYTIKARGYGVSLTSVELYDKSTFTTSTLKSPIKHWSVTANLNSFTCQGLTDISAGVGIEYSLNKWRFGGGYQVFTNGNSGVTFRIERKILQF